LKLYNQLVSSIVFLFILSSSQCIVVKYGKYGIYILERFLDLAKMALCGVIRKQDDQIGCSQSHQSECGVWLGNELQVAGHQASDWLHWLETVIWIWFWQQLLVHKVKM